ncbi:metallohydrolase [Pseudomonas sp. ODNR1LW]|nr:metallohydrolase [Pseudomonas sp. ODNR1LW]
MAARMTFFPVGCGDMTLVQTDADEYILIDCHIRASADDPDNDDVPDVAQQLRDRLPRDDNDRPYVDAMMLSHPDKDHCCGLSVHFHLGPIADYPANSDKIVIREMWSSPIVFRRASVNHILCDDAKAWAKEARRRVARYRALGYCPDQERILIMGEDVDGKTDDLGAILVKADENWTAINGTDNGAFRARLLAPMKASDDDEEEVLSKNNSSIVSRMKFASGSTSDACRFLSGGDAEVAIWEKLWARNSENADECFAYDLLLAPHHCSWHSLSWDSWSQYGEDAEVSPDARDALGQARDGAVIVASSKTIVDDDKDPPCIRAKREYENILDGVSDGDFLCVADQNGEPLEYYIKPGGLARVTKSAKAPVAATAASVISSAAVIGRQPLPHG